MCLILQDLGEHHHIIECPLHSHQQFLKSAALRSRGVLSTSLQDKLMQSHWYSSGCVPLGLDIHSNHPPLAHWIAINLSIHHWRCRLVNQEFLLNEEAGCAYARFLRKILF